MTRALKDIATRDEVLRVIIGEIARLRHDGAGRSDDIRPESSLVLDLGIDSISMIEVAAAIEGALKIQELSLRTWRDREAERVGPRYTVGSLVDLCLETALL